MTLRRDAWRVGDAASLHALDIAAGRPPDLTRRIDGDELELMARHGLLGIMATSEHPDLRAAALPPFARLAARHQIMRRHLREVLTLLDEHDIRAAVLKGPALASWAYRNPLHRTYTDVDIIVERKDLDRVVPVLERYPHIRGIPPKTPKADKRNIPLRDPNGVSFTVDLHWDLFSYSQLRHSADGATPAAWAEAKPDPDSDLGPSWDLPREMRLAFLCAHALLDHRFRLILFRDLVEVARLEPDWDRLGDYATRFSLRSTTYVALLYAARLVDAAVPEEVLRALRPRSLPVRAVELMSPRVDIARFDGHSVHPLNLATVLLHDERRVRAGLALQAPAAFPHWRSRVEARQRRDALARRKPPSVMIVVASNRRRGAEVFGSRLATGLKGHGWNTQLVGLTADPAGPWVDATTISERTPGDVGRFEPKVVRGLRREIQEQRPDVVLANGGATLRYAIAATRGMRNRPRIAYASIGEPSYWLRDLPHRMLQRMLHAPVDRVLAVSRMTGSQLTDLVGVPAAKIRVAHTGIPEDFLETDAREHSDVLRLLFLGNISAEKDPCAAVQVLRDVAAVTPATLRFVGRGPLRRAVEAEAQTMGLAAQVEFTGSVEDVRPHLAWADLLVLTSKTEGFPGVVLEAAAARVPTVAYGVGGTDETLVDGETGVLVTPGNHEEFVAAVVELAGDPARRAAMGDAARRRVQEQFLMHHAVERHHELLIEMLPR